MGLKRRGSAVPQPGWNARDWSNWGEDQIVTPDNGTVTPGSLAPETVTQIGDTAADAADVSITAHVAAVDPHVQYAQHSEVSIAASNAQNSAQASAAAALAAHVAAVDPHAVYLTQTEGDARYRELTDAVTYAELTGKPAALALIFTGTGTPEAAVTAGKGSLFLRTDGGVGSTLYYKSSGTGNTGWTAVA